MLVKVLRSGSGGNACYVELGGTRLLVDAGVPLEVITRELAPLGVTPADLDALLLTHEHDDHARGAGLVARLAAAPVLATTATLQAAARFLPDGAGEPVEAESTVRVGAVTVEAFPVPHDAADPVGFRLAGPDGVVVIAVDLGAPTGALRERVADADVLVLEANYDLRLLGVSAYPWFLKNRIIAPTGHLSNEGAAQAASWAPRVRAVVLTHLSEVNNLAPLARDVVLDARRYEGLPPARVEAVRPNTAGPPIALA
jgi:phosphoribosyl 1,2-cyclic phosphodiesterase